MRKLAMWIVNNIPCGKIAPFLLGYAIGATKTNKSLKAEKKDVSV